MLTSKFALEKYRVFPYIAWAIVFCFSLFVYHLTQTLADATHDLGMAKIALENDVLLPVASIDFNHPTSTTSTHKK